MNSLLTSVQVLMPVIRQWCEEQEKTILEKGTPLTESQLVDARRAGVKNPEKIRVVRLETLPSPDHDDLQFIAKQVGLYSARSMGMSLGHGICLRRDLKDERAVLVHECVHVSQYEKKNGIPGFLHDYLRECIDPGYPFGPMEQEAILVSKDICK